MLTVADRVEIAQGLKAGWSIQAIAADCQVAVAIAGLCEHLTATKTRYPGADLILRYEIKDRA